jgi:hypothetical protein
MEKKTERYILLYRKILPILEGHTLEEHMI